MTKKVKVLNFVPFVISFCFLFNPNITVFDLLPDFIGYIILSVALSRIADMNDTVWDALKIFKRMIFIDAAKILAIFWIFGMTYGGERNTSILLWTFVFSVVELICLIPAYSKLFNGIIQIGYRVPNESIFAAKKGRIDFIRIITFVFIIAKAVLTVLPEFADLTSRTYDDSFGYDIAILYDYIGLMRGLAFIPVLFIGIFWLVTMITFFNRLNKDALLTNSLDSKYLEEIQPRKGLFIRRNFKTVELLAIVTLCLTIDFRIESQNIIPDFLAAGMFFLLFLFLQKHISVKPKSWIYSTVAFAYSSIVSSIIEGIFFTDYYYGAIIRSDNAKSLYILMVIANILKSLTMIAVLYDMNLMLVKTINLHTGYISGIERFSASENRMIKAQQSELKKMLLFADISAVLYIVSDICYDFIAPYAGFMGLINIVFALLCIGMFVRILFAIRTAIDTKYMLE